MSKPRYYKSNIKQQIHSLSFKNKYFYLKNTNISRYGLCQAEAELLAEIANYYYQNHLLDVPENSFSISLYQINNSNKKTNLNTLPKKTINIPAFSHYELEILRFYGLKSLQNYRILNMLDHIAPQNAQIDINLLAKIVNMTPKSIRGRLMPFFKMCIKLPLTFLSHKHSSKRSLFRCNCSINCGIPLTPPLSTGERGLINGIITTTPSPLEGGGLGWG